MTLSKVVALQAELLPQEEKEWLAGVLFPLREESTGSIEGDIQKVSKLINE